MRTWLNQSIFLNYLIYYSIHEQDQVMDVINILPHVYQKGNA
ncbi:hypothetical protein [Paenibacillus senegalensis]|nr:hypothetical protein [Paenibacillus senegalensis]